MVTGKLERGTIVTGSACDVLGMDERKKATVAGQCADSLLVYIWWLIVSYHEDKSLPLKQSAGIVCSFLSVVHTLA